MSSSVAPATTAWRRAVPVVGWWLVGGWLVVGAGCEIILTETKKANEQD